MLKATDEVLRVLLDQMEALTALCEQDDEPGLRQQLADVEYTLCVVTGTRDIHDGLSAARDQLATSVAPADVPEYLHPQQ